MKTAAACANLQDIRAAIDQLDHDIITLIGQRYEYVQAAVKFKTNNDSVKAPDRVAAMMLQRREWALEVGLNPDVIEKLYRDLVAYFIQDEMKRLHA